MNAIVSLIRECKAEFGIWKLLLETLTFPLALLVIIVAASVWLDIASETL